MWILLPVLRRIVNVWQEQAWMKTQAGNRLSGEVHEGKWDKMVSKSMLGNSIRFLPQTGPARVDRKHEERH
jgi:hypothetical protein